MNVTLHTIKDMFAQIFEDILFNISIYPTTNKTTGVQVITNSMKTNLKTLSIPLTSEAEQAKLARKKKRKNILLRRMKRKTKPVCISKHQCMNARIQTVHVYSYMNRICEVTFMGHRM